MKAWRDDDGRLRIVTRETTEEAIVAAVEEWRRHVDDLLYGTAQLEAVVQDGCIVRITTQVRKSHGGVKR